eukprot:m.813804 g.813804  ORF g.813804 m.813804 type:complete len:816 (+) comp59362_c0_seq1:195-2642(+)
MTSIEGWSNQQVVGWVKSVGLGEHAALFRQHEVDGALLQALDSTMLQEMGIPTQLARTKILLRIKKAVEENTLAYDNPLPAQPEEPVDPFGDSFGSSHRTLSEDLVSPRTPDVARSGRAPVSQQHSLAQQDRDVSPPPQEPLLPLERQSVFDSGSMAKYQEAVSSLTTMFPTLGHARVEEALQVNQGRVEAAIDMLLALSVTDTRPSPASSTTSTMIAQQRSMHRQLDAAGGRRPPTATDASMPWFHKHASREHAEQLLCSFGASDGLFLIRESSTITGALVLSMCSMGEIVHHVIYSERGQFELFNLTFVTLPSLVQYLQHRRPEHNWMTPLSYHVPYAATTAEDPAARVSRGRSGSFHSSRSLEARDQHVQRFHVDDRAIMPTFSQPYETRAPPSSSATSAGAPRSQAGVTAFTNPFFAGRTASEDLPPSAFDAGRVGTPPPSRREEFDLEISEDDGYEGDVIFEATVQMTQELRAVGFRRPDRTCFLRTCMACMQLSEEMDGQILLELPYEDIEVVDSNPTTVCLIAQGRSGGVYFFELSEARVLARTLRENAVQNLLREDKRMAQLLQSEEFLQRLERNADFQEALREDRRLTPLTEPGTFRDQVSSVQEGGKAKSVLQKLMKKMTIKSKPKVKKAPKGYFQNLRTETGPDKSTTVRPPGFFDRRPQNIPQDVVPILSEDDVEVSLRDQWSPSAQGTQPRGLYSDLPVSSLPQQPQPTYSELPGAASPTDPVYQNIAGSTSSQTSVEHGNSLDDDTARGYLTVDEANAIVSQQRVAPPLPQRNPVPQAWQDERPAYRPQDFDENEDASLMS